MKIMLVQLKLSLAKKVTSLSKHLEQLIQVPDWVMFNRRSRLSNNMTGKGLYIRRIHDRSSGSERQKYFGDINIIGLF